MKWQDAIGHINAWNENKVTDMAQPITSADWKKRGGLTGKAFGLPMNSNVMPQRNISSYNKISWET